VRERERKRKREGEREREKERERVRVRESAHIGEGVEVVVNEERHVRTQILHLVQGLELGA